MRKTVIIAVGAFFCLAIPSLAQSQRMQPGSAEPALTITEASSPHAQPVAYTSGADSLPYNTPAFYTYKH